MIGLADYAYLTRHIVPGPQEICYFIPLILLPASLLIPRSILSRWLNAAIFMPIIILCSIRAWQAMGGVDVISVNSLLWSLFLITLTDPQQDFRIVRYAVLDDKQTSAQLSEEHYPADTRARLFWVGKLLPAIRLDYWRISRESHDRGQPPVAGFKDARSFLVRSAVSLVRGFLILDATRAYIEHDVYFNDPSIAVTAPLPYGGLRGPMAQAVRSMIAGAQAYALIGEMFYLPAAIPVLLSSVGLLPEQYSPHTWPPYFGPMSAMFDYGVRGFWGTFWHQSMRWTTTGPGYALADVLDLGRGSLLRYGVLSLSAFGLSGIVHAGLVPPEPRFTRGSVDGIRLSLAGFFWTQSIATCLEAVIGRVMTALTGEWKSGRRRSARRTVNAIWLVVWFSISLPLLMDAVRQLGYWRPWPLPFSLWNWVIGRGLLTW